MSLPSLTFAELKTEMSKRSQSGDSVSPGSLPNALSALSQFMSERGFSDDQCVSTQMRTGYFREINAHVKALQAQKRPGEYIRNRKALLKRWRLLVLALDRAAASQAGTQTPFQHALRALFDAVGPVKTIATRLCVPYATIKRWLAGSLPRSDAVHHVVALEGYFAQPRGTLLDLLPVGCVPQSLRSDAGSLPSMPVIAFRERLAGACKEPYALKEVSAQLKSEWKDLLHHKTSLGAGLKKRQRKGVWSLTQLPVRPLSQTQTHWYATVGVPGGALSFCQTAQINWGYVTQYLGWRVLSSEAGGAGLTCEETQSLVCLTDLEHMDAYLEWRRARSGGALHEGIASFFKLISSLCHPITGYLTQSRDRFSWHPDAASDVEWVARCQAAVDFAKSVQQLIKDRGKKSRDPEAPVAHIMALANPLHAVTDAIARMDAARPSTGGVQEAKWARDRLMVKLLQSNPLRAKNLKLLTIETDPPQGAPAQLRKVKGEWRIAIDKEAFKNFAGAAKDRDYDMRVRKEVWKDLEMYIEKYRPLLASSSNPYLFTVGQHCDEPYHHLNRHFAAITRRYFTRCPGTGPHIMRHIAATTILKLHPNAWAAAAYILHDQEATVRKNYAHLRSDDAARWVDALMTEALAGL